MKAIFDPVPLEFYLSGVSSDSLKEVFETHPSANSWTNFSLCRRGFEGGHYVTAVKLNDSDEWLLLDGIGKFKGMFYRSIENLIKDLNDYTKGFSFNLYSARYIGDVREGK